MSHYLPFVYCVFEIWGQISVLSFKSLPHIWSLSFISAVIAATSSLSPSSAPHTQIQSTPPQLWMAPSRRLSHWNDCGGSYTIKKEPHPSAEAAHFRGSRRITAAAGWDPRLNGCQIQSEHRFILSVKIIRHQAFLLPLKWNGKWHELDKNLEETKKEFSLCTALFELTQIANSKKVIIFAHKIRS